MHMVLSNSSIAKILLGRLKAEKGRPICVDAYIMKLLEPGTEWKDLAIDRDKWLKIYLCQFGFKG